jgi:hypothetical protein
MAEPCRQGAARAVVPLAQAQLIVEVEGGVTGPAPTRLPSRRCAALAPRRNLTLRRR